MNIYILVTVVNGFTSTDIITDKIRIRGLITLNPTVGETVCNEYYDYTEFCEKKEIECIQIEDYGIKEGSDVRRIKGLDIDLLLVLGWQRLIPGWMIERCTIGAIGCHGSAWGIKAGRGRSPQNWALIAGIPEFYISIFWLDDSTDSGAVISTEKFEYSELDDVETSYMKCGILTAKMIISFIEGGAKRNEGIEQKGDAYYLPQRKPEDGEIDWSRNGNDIYNFVRALSHPYPGAYSMLNGKKIVIWRCRVIGTDALFRHKKCGEVILALPGDKIVVKCGDSLIYIDEYELMGTGGISKGDVLSSADFSKQMEDIINRHYSKYDMKLNPDIEKLGEAQELQENI